MTGLASRLLACVLLLLFSSAAADAATKKVAMVVGNSAYQSLGALPNTLNDATAVAASLERIGFTVFPAYDLTQAALLDEFAKFSDALEGADSAVFYYAGHGIQIDAENYILPVDLKLENEMSVRYGALSLTDVLRDIEARSRVSIVILDACRDNPLADMLAAEDPSRSANVARGLAPMKPSGNGTIIAYAAAPGQVASDGDDGHSPYTGALLGEIEKPGVEVGLLFRRVAGHVIDETGGIQRPEILVRLASEYYLSDLPPPLPAVEPPPLPVAAATPEPAPVDVAQATPVAAPSAAEDRQATDASGTRAALWDYASTLVVSPYDPPSVAWPTPESEEAGETEGNTTFGTAALVGPNDNVPIAISPAGDQEFLRFAVQQGGRLIVQAPEVPADITLGVRLLNANGDEVVYWVMAPRPGGELYAEFDIGRPGAYWLHVADGSGDAASNERINLNLQYEVEADLYEPNDRADTAKHVALDGAFPISIFPIRDRDYFKYTAPSTGSLIVSLTGAPEAVTTTVRLLDANGTELVYWTPAPRGGGDNLTIFDLPRPGVYYIEIADNGDAASDVGPIQLATRFAPSPDLFEPNDAMGAAYPVEPTSTSTMAIFPARDSDWLELDIDQPGELLLDIASPPDNLQLTWRVVDANGTELQYWAPAGRPGGDLSGSFDFPRPGRYYLQLADNNNVSSLEPFEVQLSFTESLDAYEPNNTLGAAKPLTPGGEVQFTMLPLRDADWFRVSVDQPGELAIAIDEGPENLDLTYRVVNSDWTELAYWVAAYRKGGLTEGSVDLPRAGTYYIEVRDSGDDGRSIEPATLKTAFTPTVGSNEPNNTYGEATPVDITGETVAHILPLADGDWHVFYADGPGELDVEITGVPENLDIAFRVLDAERTEIQYWISAPRPGGDTTGTVVLPHAGWYWMEIRDGGNDARSPLPFTVKRTFRKS